MQIFRKIKNWVGVLGFEKEKDIKKQKSAMYRYSNNFFQSIQNLMILFAVEFHFILRHWEHMF